MAVLRTQSDERLVRLVREGSEEAFEVIVERYRAMLLRYCSGLIDFERAEDAVQSAFTNVLLFLRRSNDPVIIEALLRRAVRNNALKMLERKSNFDTELTEDLVPGRSDADLAEVRDRFRRTVDGIQSLSVGERRALLMREFEGLTYDEMAIALDSNPNAVRQLLHRVRTKLRNSVGALLPLPFVRWVDSAGGAASVGLGVKAAVAVSALGVAAIGAGEAIERRDSVSADVPAQASTLPSQGDTGTRHARAGTAHRDRRTRNADVPAQGNSPNGPATHGAPGKGDPPDDPRDPGHATPVAPPPDDRREPPSDGQPPPQTQHPVSVSSSGSTIDVAGGDEPNAIQVERSGERLMVTDSSAAMSAAAPCSSESATRVSCPRAGVDKVVIDGNGGDDDLSAGDLAGAGLDIWADEGNDRVGYSGDVGASLSGGPGNDVVRGGSGSDLIGGFAGDDVIDGRGGVDWINGDLGDDVLCGGSSADGDLITGAGGDDRIDGGGGQNRLIGGAGTDTFFGDLSFSETPDPIDQIASGTLDCN